MRHSASIIYRLIRLGKADDNVLIGHWEYNKAKENEHCFREKHIIPQVVCEIQITTKIGERRTFKCDSKASVSSRTIRAKFNRDQIAAGRIRNGVVTTVDAIITMR